MKAAQKQDEPNKKKSDAKKSAKAVLETKKSLVDSFREKFGLRLSVRYNINFLQHALLLCKFTSC